MRSIVNCVCFFFMYYFFSVAVVRIAGFIYYDNATTLPSSATKITYEVFKRRGISFLNNPRARLHFLQLRVGLMRRIHKLFYLLFCSLPLPHLSFAFRSITLEVLNLNHLSTYLVPVQEREYSFSYEVKLKLPQNIRLHKNDHSHKPHVQRLKLKHWQKRCFNTCEQTSQSAAKWSERKPHDATEIPIITKAKNKDTLLNIQIYA